MLSKRMNPGTWPEIKQMITTKIAEKTKVEWTKIFENTDACFAPVLSMDEVTSHPHNVARKIFQNVNDILQPAPGTAI